MSSMADRLEALADPTSSSFQYVSQMLLAKRAARKEEKRKNTITVKIPCKLQGKELSRLQKEFGWNLESVDRCPTQSPFYTAKVFCCSHFNSQLKAWDGEEVLTFDMNLMTLAAKSKRWVHSCCTRRDALREAAYLEQLAALDRAIKGKNDFLATGASTIKQQFNQGAGPMVCTDARNCDRAVDTILLDFPVTGMPVEQLARAMEQHQASRAKVWFFFEVAMFTENDGPLTSMDGKFYIDRDVDTVYIFSGDNTRPVAEYSYSAMMSYVTQSAFTEDGKDYVVELHDSLDGVRFAQVTGVDNIGQFDIYNDIHFFRPAGESMTVIEQRWSPSQHYYEHTLFGEQQFVRTVVSTVSLDKVLSRALCADVSKLTLDMCRAYVRDVTSQEITSGSVVKRGRGLATATFEQLAQYVYKRAIRERFEADLEVKRMTKIERARSSYTEWINMCIDDFLQTGAEFAEIAHRTLATMLRGAAQPVLDYTYKTYELSKSIILRDVLCCIGDNKPSVRYVSYMPGCVTLSSAASICSTVAVIARARVQADKQAWDEIGASIEDLRVEERDGKSTFRTMGLTRDKLVAKMADNYGAHSGSISFRKFETLDDVAQPVTTQVSKLSDPVVAINHDYRDNMPGLDDVDVGIRTHLASTSDRIESFYCAERRLNRDKDALARDQNVRRSKIVAAGGGRRPITQVETVLCFNKRVNNAPRAHLPRDYDALISKQLDRFERVCFRDDWRETVFKRVDEGMWRNRLSELAKTVDKATTVNVTSMLREAYCDGEIDMTTYAAIVKPVPKSKVSQSVAHEYTPTQTIMYQKSKMTNAKHSSLLSEFHDTLDEILLPHINFNARRDFSKHEKWFNSFRSRRAQVQSKIRQVELDVSQCDKSHILYNWCLYLAMLRRLGCPDEHLDLIGVMAGRKTATAEMAGMLIVFYEQLMSGAHLTISFNSMVCGIAAIDALELEPHQVITGQFTGDDSLLELVCDLDIDRASSRMRDSNNLEAKIFEVSDPYFCSHYYILWDGYYFMMRDPGKLVENLSRHITAGQDVKELWISYCDAVKHYDKQEPLDGLAVAFAKRAEWKTVPYGMLRGLASLTEESEFFSLFGEVEIYTA